MKKLFTLTGPSCSGKTTLLRRLLDTEEFCEVVSFTSRQPRGGEVHGKDYYFLEPKVCEELVKNDECAEHIKFKDNYYGITKAEIESKMTTDKTPIVIVEPKGLVQLVKKFDVFPIYVDCPLETLYYRYLLRFKQDPNPNVEYEARRIASLYGEWFSWMGSFEDAVTGIPHEIIGKFDADNEAAIVSFVSSLVEQQK